MRKNALFLIISTIISIVSTSEIIAQTNCAASAIQTNLDNGMSVQKLLENCSSLQPSNFIRKNFAGGVIVYLDQGRNGTGIVAANEDANSNSTWLSNNLDLNYFSTLTPSFIGAGILNTTRFCRIEGDQENSTTCVVSSKQRWQGNGPNLYGFYFATQYKNDGYSDWYMPSLDELKTGITNVEEIFTGCPSGGWWTSTQVPQDYISQANQNENVISAFAVNSDSVVQVVNKLDGRCVRPFRTVGPWINDLSHNILEAGMKVNIDASNYGNYAANIEIQLPNGKKVFPQILSDSLIFTVPNGVTSGKLRMVVNGVQSNQVDITIAPKPAGVPKIDSISVHMYIKSATFARDKLMTITGENFSLVENKVTFAGDNAGNTVLALQTATSDQIHVQIPSTALTGPIHVTNSVGESEASEDTLHVFEVSTPAGTLTKNKLNQVAVDSTGKVMVAVGDNGTILKSEDRGKTWTDSTFVVPFIKNPDHQVRIDSTKIFMNAMKNGRIHTVVYSKTWKNFIAWGELGTPFKGKREFNMQNNDPSRLSWNSNVTNDLILRSIAVGNQVIVSNLNNRSISSLKEFGDRNIFKFDILQLGPNEIMAFAADSSTIVTVGQNSVSFYNSTVPATSLSWVKQPFDNNLRSVAYGNGVFAAVGPDTDGGFFYSNNGAKWSSATCNGGCKPNSAIAYNEKFGLFFTGGPSLSNYYSVNGRQWAEFTLPTRNPNSSCTATINHIKPTGEGFIMVGGCGYVVRLVRIEPEH